LVSNPQVTITTATLLHSNMDLRILTPPSSPEIKEEKFHFPSVSPFLHSSSPSMLLPSYQSLLAKASFPLPGGNSAFSPVMSSPPSPPLERSDPSPLDYSTRSPVPSMRHLPPTMGSFPSLLPGLNQALLMRHWLGAAAGFSRSSPSVLPTSFDPRLIRGQGRRPKKRYICKHCNREFSKSYNLLIHERTHTDERPYPCETCGKAFRRMDHLRDHQYTHAAVKPYNCTGCGKGFCQARTLAIHKATCTKTSNDMEQEEEIDVCSNDEDLDISGELSEDEEKLPKVERSQCLSFSIDELMKK